MLRNCKSVRSYTDIKCKATPFLYIQQGVRTGLRQTLNTLQYVIQLTNKIRVIVCVSVQCGNASLHPVLDVHVTWNVFIFYINYNLP